MLLRDAHIIRDCPKDTDLAEVIGIGQERVQLSNGGHKFEPRYTGVYVQGLPFGDNRNAVLAPVALQAGDHLKVVHDGITHKPYQVFRKAKLFWADEAIQSDADNVAAEKQAARETAKAAR